MDLLRELRLALQNRAFHQDSVLLYLRRVRGGPQVDLKLAKKQNHKKTLQCDDTSHPWSAVHMSPFSTVRNIESERWVAPDIDEKKKRWVGVTVTVYTVRIRTKKSICTCGTGIVREWATKRDCDNSLMDNNNMTGNALEVKRVLLRTSAHPDLVAHCGKNSPFALYRVQCTYTRPLLSQTRTAIMVHIQQSLFGTSVPTV